MERVMPGNICCSPLTTKRAQCQSRCLYQEFQISRFSLISHLCICLLKSPDTALYTLWGLPPCCWAWKLHPWGLGQICIVLSELVHILQVHWNSNSEEGRLFPCIFRSCVCLLGVFKEIKRSSAYWPYRSSRTSTAQSKKSFGGQSGNGVLSHFRHVLSYLQSGIPSEIHLPLPAKSLFSDWRRTESSASSLFTTL